MTYRMFNMISPQTDFWDEEDLDKLLKQAKIDVQSYPISIIDLERSEEVATSNKHDYIASGFRLIFIQ